MHRLAAVAVLPLLCLVAARAGGEPEERAAAEARLRAALAGLPEPSAAGGFTFEGEILVKGVAAGSFAVSARPARLPGKDEGPLHWLLAEHREWGKGDEAVEVQARAYVTRALQPVQGELRKTEYGETSTWAWSRRGGRLRVVHTGPSVEPMQRLIEDKRPTLTTMAAAILFARHAPAEPAAYGGQSFHPDFNLFLGQDPLVDLTLTLEGKQPWRERPAFVVRGRWRHQDLTLALDPERRAPLGWRLVRKDAPPVDHLPKGESAKAPPEAADALFTSPAKSAQAAAVRAGYAFATGDMEILGDVIHWPTLRERMGDRVPKSVTPEAFRSGLLGRIEETTKNPQPPELMQPVLKGLLGTLKEEKTDGGVRVTFPPMFRSLVMTVAEIDGVWYLVELP